MSSARKFFDTKSAPRVKSCPPLNSNHHKAENILVLNKPRQSSIVGGGMRLPGARVVTQIVHPTYSRDDRINSHMVMQWGQFLDHDLTLTPVVPLENADCEFFTYVIH